MTSCIEIGTIIVSVRLILLAIIAIFSVLWTGQYITVGLVIALPGIIVGVLLPFAILYTKPILVLPAIVYLVCEKVL